MSDQPKLLGITGGIGAGKTTICNILETLGYKIYYADERAKWLMENNKKLVLEITDMLGKNAYIKGKLNNKYIAKNVFEDPLLLDKLNKIVHPQVKKDTFQWVKLHKNEKVLFKEAAILFETGAYKTLDGVMLVVANRKLRMKRLQTRDADQKLTSKIMKQQANDDAYAPLANWVIENNENRSVIQQVIDTLAAINQTNAYHNN